MAEKKHTENNPEWWYLYSLRTKQPFSWSYLGKKTKNAVFCLV